MRHTKIARQTLPVDVVGMQPGKVYKGDREGPGRVGSLTLFKVREAG